MKNRVKKYVLMATVVGALSGSKILQSGTAWPPMSNETSSFNINGSFTQTVDGPITITNTAASLLTVTVTGNAIITFADNDLDLTDSLGYGILFALNSGAGSSLGFKQGKYCNDAVDITLLNCVAPNQASTIGDNNLVFNIGIGQKLRFIPRRG